MDLESVDEYSAGGVVVQDGRVLIIEHKRGEWGMPKGHLEGRETAKEAAIREILEETGLECILGKALGVTRYDFERAGTVVHKQVSWFIAIPRAGEARPQISEGIVRVAWLEPRVALAKLTFDLDRTVLSRALEIIGLEL